MNNTHNHHQALPTNTSHYSDSNPMTSSHYFNHNQQQQQHQSASNSNSCYSAVNMTSSHSATASDRSGVSDFGQSHAIAPPLQVRRHHVARQAVVQRQFSHDSDVSSSSGTHSSHNSAGSKRAQPHEVTATSGKDFYPQSNLHYSLPDQNSVAVHDIGHHVTSFPVRTGGYSSQSGSFHSVLRHCLLLPCFT